MTAQAYPLHWPQGFPRTKAREKGKFQTSLAGALKNVRTSMTLFANDSGKNINGIVISSNYSLGVERPADPGVSVWFTWDGLDLCIAVDRYLTVEANLQAIHHILEARRVEIRHGTLALVHATFQGFRALPPPADQKSWREVLNLGENDNDLEKARMQYKRLAAERHPDRGGSDAQMAELNAAWEQAQEALQ